MKIIIPLWARAVLAAALLLVAFGLGMRAGAPSGAHDHDSTQGEAETWTCSMHPQIQMPEPGACPMCGMDLIPLAVEAGVSSEVVTLSPRAQVLAKLQTTAVARQQGSQARLHLLGRVEYNETTRRDVTSWIGGRIERLHVNVTGEQVSRGQVIATLYSPEVYSAHQDLLTAKGQVTRLADSPAAAQKAAAAALAAARERLRLLGLSTSEVDAMASAASPRRTVKVRSPFEGTVVERLATEGAYTQTGTPLYRIADLRSLWVQLDAYEADLPRLAVGQAVSLTVDGLGGQAFEGAVAFIDPTVDRSRRTAQVRVQIDNPSGQLRPGMFAEAVVSVDDRAEAPLVVPATAPLFTGKRSIVYTEVEPGRYAPRTVRLGPRLGDFYPVVSGLSEGEHVVSRGAFSLDADLQIRGGSSMMAAQDDNTAGVDEIVLLSPAQRAPLRPVVERYLAVQAALAEDDLAATVSAAAALEAAVAETALEADAAAPWAEVAAALQQHTQHVQGADSLEAARAGFEPLSLSVERLLQRFGNPLDEAVQVAFCPMAKGSNGARWVQQGEVIDNAYFGASMRRCGEIRSTVSPGTHLPAPPAPAAPAHRGHQH